MKYDLHIHSCLSPCGDADMTPNNIAGMAMLSGIRLAALTDHNTTLNCPAFFKACERVGIVPIAGMELTTAEEIHMVCLFPTLESAMEFGKFVDGHRMKIPNRPDIFGEQIVMNEHDEEIGREESLLIAASDLDVVSAYNEVVARGGAAFPAHIDKSANGIISILGDFPPEPPFKSAEFHDMNNAEEYLKKYPILDGLHLLNASDAHYLTNMSVDPPNLHVDDSDDDADVRMRVIKYLRGEN